LASSIRPQGEAPMKSKHVPVVLGLALASAFAVSAGGASVDLEIRSGDRVRGTIRPTFDTENFICDLPKNSVLTATVKGASKIGPAFQLAFRKGGIDVPGPVFAPKGLGGSLKPLPVDSSGQYQVRVFVDDGKDGDYDLSVSWKPQLLWTRSGGPLEKDGIDTLQFSAPAGSTATIEVMPGKGSTFQGALLDVTGPNAFHLDLSDMLVKRFVLPGLPTTGDYAVNFTNLGEPGTWTARVRLRPARFRPRKFDLRDTALGGAFAGDHAVFGRIVDVGGGTLLVQTEFGSPIDGSSVSIPADSLGAPVVITVSAGPPIEAEDSNGAGPSVDFGPSGTEFDPTKAATVTIPFDPSFFPGGDTSTLVVYVRDADGTVTEVPKPYTFDGNTVSFSTSHFSAFQAHTNLPRPLEGDFYFLDVSGFLAPNFEGSFGYGLNPFNAAQGGAGVSDFSSRIEWYNFGAQGAGVGMQRADGQQTGFAVTVQDDQTVILSDPAKGSTIHTLSRGKSNDVLISKDAAAVLLRRARQPMTPALLVGTWHLFHLDARARVDQAVPPSATLQLQTETGNVAFKIDGSVLAATALRQSSSQTQYPTGQWQPFLDSVPPGKVATFEIIEGGRVEITTEEGSKFSLEAVVDGNVLVGTETSNDPGEGVATGLYILVRNAKGQSAAKLAGQYRFVEQATKGFDNPPSTEPPRAQSFAFSLANYFGAITAPLGFSMVGNQSSVVPDDAGDPLFQQSQPYAPAGRIVVAADGSFTIKDLGLLGAAAIGNGFLVMVETAPSGVQRIAFGVTTTFD
jgi:hypothetical protein